MSYPNSATVHARACRVLQTARAYANHPGQVSPRRGVNVFHETQPPEMIDWIHSFFEDDRHAFVSLARVCRLWRDLVYNSPVWANCERVHHATTASLMPATYEWPFELDLPRNHSEAVTILSELGPKIHFLVVGIKWPTILDFAESGCHSLDWIAEHLRKLAWRVNVHCRKERTGASGLGLYDNHLSALFHQPNALHGKLPLSRIVFMHIACDFWGALADIVRNRRADFPLTSVELLYCSELTDVSCLADVHHVRTMVCPKLIGIRALTRVKHLEVGAPFNHDIPKALRKLLAASRTLETLDFDVGATKNCHSGCPHDLSFVFGDVLLAAKQNFAARLSELHLRLIAAEHLQPLANARGLRRVSISSAPRLTDLGALQQLEALSLSDVAVVDFTSLFPEDAAKPSRLRRLQVLSCPSIESFAGLRRAHALEELMVGSGISGDAIRSKRARHYPWVTGSTPSEALLDILPALSATLKNFQFLNISYSHLFSGDPVFTNDERCAWEDGRKRAAPPRGQGFKLTLFRCANLSASAVTNLLCFVEMCLEPLEELHLHEMGCMTNVLAFTADDNVGRLSALTRASFVWCPGLTNVAGLEVIPELDLHWNDALSEVAILGTGRVRALNLWRCQFVDSAVGLHTIHALTLGGTGIETIVPLLGENSAVKILDVRQCPGLWGDTAEIEIEASDHEFYWVCTSGASYEPDAMWSEMLAHA